MSNYLVRGFHFQDSSKKLELKLPTAREYKLLTVDTSSEKVQPLLLIKHAVSMRQKSFLKRGWSKPVIYRGYEEVRLYNSLQQILSKHPFPLQQGPSIPQLDCAAYSNETENDMLIAKTIFNHSESQECGHWTPIHSGLNGWGILTENTPQMESQCETFTVSQIENGIQGPASSKNDMNLLYTCQLQNCIIRCPCSICKNTTEQCEANCESKMCQQCTQQCTLHKLKLPWSFNAKTDHFTMVTQDINYIQFATPYAGIPLHCESCSSDVLEHQILHLVVHLRCKFCCLEFRPFDKKSIVTTRDFIEAERNMIKDENRTCSICFIRLKDQTARERHEIRKHRPQEKKLKCDLCNKSYLDMTGLKHHNETKHGAIHNHKCELCKGIFSSYSALSGHKRIAHIEENQSKCSDCEKIFTSKQALIRHKREVHRYTMANMDYAPDDSDILECKECDATFMRESNLRRHKETVHGSGNIRKIIKCPSCGQDFSRKDNLTRHMKKNNC